YVRITDSSVVAYVTLQFEERDLQFSDKEGVDTAAVNVYGTVTSMTRKPIARFEPTLKVDAPPDMLEAYKNQKEVYQQAVPLPPGRYRLNIVAKDINSGNTNVYEAALDVPHFTDDRLASTSLFLADTIERLPTNSIGGGKFTIGDLKVRPRVGETFNLSSGADPKMGVYMQFYNFAPDEKTNKPEGNIEYIINKIGTKDSLFDVTEDLSQVPFASANQVTVQKLLPLKTLGPGVYTLTVKATDKRANQTVQQQEKFIVN